MPEPADTNPADPFPEISDEAHQAAMTAMSVLADQQRDSDGLHPYDHRLYLGTREALLDLLTLAACPVVCDGHRPTPEQVADGKTDWHVLCQRKAAAAYAALSRGDGL